jgi:bilirubin oxidase
MKHFCQTALRRAWLFAILMAGPWVATTLQAQAPFTIAMEVPPIVNTRNDTLTVDQEFHDFGSIYNRVATLAYNYGQGQSNSYLGPTLTWFVGDTQTTTIYNKLPNSTNFRTTVHWHGANIPAWTDGGPHQYFDPSDSFQVKFKVIDEPTTLWYHPHAEDRTYTQVQAGLAGIIIVRKAGDPVEAIAPSTYGHDDFPIILQDIHFPTDSTLDTTKGPGGNPDRLMVTNGTIQPYLDILPQPTRFRFLNGSSRNSYSLSIVSDTNNLVGSRIPFYIISSDGGYIPDAPVQVTTLETGPGIRNGVILNLNATNANQTLYLVNTPADLAPPMVGSATNRPPLRNILVQFRVAATPVPPLGTLPATLPGIPSADTLGPVYRTDTFELRDSSNIFSINDNQYDFNKVNTIVYANTKEDWVITNTSKVAHPFHIHLVQFYVMSYQDTVGSPKLKPGDPGFPAEYLGPKDDFMVKVGSEIRVRIWFNSYSRKDPFTSLDSSAYMYHCHILTHEDGYYSPNSGTIQGRAPYGMMQQFVVWDTLPGTILGNTPQIGDEILLFPNPAGQVLNLRGESQKMTTLRIYDIQGKLLLEKVVPPFDGTHPVDISDIPRGFVIAELRAGDERKVVKKMILK